MATLLGKGFCDEEVVAQSDVHLTGTIVETLMVEFDQAKFEKAISSGSLSPKAMRKIHKVSKETKSPTVAGTPKKVLSFGQNSSNSPSAPGAGSTSAELAQRVEYLTSASTRRATGLKQPIEETSSINVNDVATKALKQAKKNAARRRRRSQR